MGNWLSDKKMKIKTNILFALAILLHLSCKKENLCDCLKGTGEIVTEERVLTDFNKIYIEDDINLVLQEDTQNFLNVEAGENLIKLIKTEIKDSCLYLRNDNKCNWMRSFKNKVNVSLHYKKLEYITYFKASGNVSNNGTLHSSFLQVDDYNGSGKITLNVDVQTSHYSLHTGPADIFISGNTDIAYLYSAGNGVADLRNMTAGGMYMNNKSTNSCYVNATNTLEVEIGYIGDVYYTGDPPNVKLVTTGSGKLIKF